MPGKVIDRLRANTSILIQSANELAVPIIATAQYPKGLGPVESFIIDQIGDQVFEKTCFSCLGASGIKDHLKQLNKRQIILVGIEAHVCVFQTAAELDAAGYKVFVVVDAIASRKLASYDNAIARLNQANINLLTTEAVVFEWLRDACHGSFRTLSKLVV